MSKNLTLRLDDGDEENEERKDFREKSRLAWTAEEHMAVGSTPPPIYRLATSQEKRRIDLMSDEEIKKYLEENIRALPKLKIMATDIPYLYEDQVKALNRDIAFLREIGRLPHGFEEISLAD